MGFIEELQRRHVPRAAAIYVAVAWGATEILAFLFEKIPVFPAWADTVMALLFVLGFPIAMFLAWRFDFGSGGLQRTRADSTVGKLTVAASLLLLFAATAGLSYLLIPRLPEAATSTNRAPPVLASAAPRNSLAVLPFENLSGDPDSEFFADGVAEQLIEALGGVEGLRVAAANSSFSFKGQERDLDDLARALDVRYLVTGSVLRAGGRLTIAGRLLDAGTGVERWSERFDGAVKDVFSFQAALARDLAEALGRELGNPGLSEQLRNFQGTGNVEVYDQYLLARQLWRQRDGDAIRRAIELLEEVVAAEPGFAPGWAALAAASLTVNSYTRVPGAWSRATEAAERALTLDETEAEAHAVLASQAVWGGRWVAAAGRYQRARELAPSNPTVRLWYSEMLVKLGQVDRALGEIGVALQLDPLYTPALGNAGHQFATAGRLEEAADAFQRTWDLGLKAMFVWFGGFYVAVQQERWEDAETWLAQRPIPHGIEADRAMLEARRNPSTATNAALVEATLGALEQGMALREAVMYLGVAGAVDEAYERLLPAADDGWRNTESLWNTWTFPLRDDPRFTELMNSVGAFAFWEIYGPPDRCRIEGQRLVCESPRGRSEAPDASRDRNVFP